MRDYRVEIVRFGEILIRANSAMEAVSQARRFGFDSAAFDDDVDIHAELAEKDARRNAKSAADIKNYGNAKGKKGGKKKQKSGFVNFPDEIPF